MSRGITRERQVKALLERDGWWVCRAAGSFGDADLVALKEGHRPLLVEVKSTAAGPFSHFGPADRAELLAAAQKAGAVAWLCHWPPHRKPVWTCEAEWPPVRAAA